MSGRDITALNARLLTGMPVQFLPGAKNVAPIAFSVPLLISILKTIQININGNVISFLFQQ